MEKLIDLPNVGKYLQGLLIDAGIETPEQLREAGAKDAFLRGRLIDSGACIRVLYGLQGAIEGIRDNDLSAQTKADLLAFFNSLK